MKNSDKGENFPDLELSFEPGLAIIALNRPKQLNALNLSLLEQFDRALDEVESRPDCRVLCVTGSGDRAFAAGADISELQQLSAEQGRRLSRRGQRLFERLENSRLFVIAAVNGFALGGGLELAMACDIRILADSAVVGLPEVSLGIIPGYGGTQRMTHLVGRSHALELIATGRKIDAETALKIGLGNRVVPAADLMETCKKIASEVLANAPLAVTASKRAVRAASLEGGDAGYQIEAREFATLCTSEDVVEGMDAFFKRRKAEFKGQ